MNKSWTTSFHGYTKMKITGIYTELFINRCIQQNLRIWDIRRVGDETMVCYILLEDIKKIRSIVRHTKVKVWFIERRGAPFFLRRMRSRVGFVAGFISFIFILFILSNMVWNIEIEGATPQIEHELNQVVKELGIKRGKFQFVLPNVEEIQHVVTNRIEAATWIGVKLNGTTYHFQVVEQTFPEKEAPISPRHLVASKKAIIHDIYVEEGKGKVVPNDFVEKGDLLISGLIGKEGRMEMVPAKGKVLGEIWYKSSVEIPLKSEYSVLTGEKKIKHSIDISKLSIPVWGFGPPEFSQYEMNENEKGLYFLKWKLPISYNKKVMLEKEKTVREYTIEEATEIATQMARKELENKLVKDSEIKSEKALHQTVENGKVKLMIHYQVLEEIAVAEPIQPIIQGD
ncbi:MAG: sporulation protein YqfD [Bacillaceae bacterium]|nr:sporulation protein YqfD [Bacillaceae bacterium]